MHFWWSGSDHLRVVRLEGVNGDVHWCCPFCGDLRLFGEEQLAAVHFQALHRPVGVGIGDLEGRDMELTASSVEMGSIEGETWSSMETAMTEEGTYSSLETTVGTNSYSSMETLPEAPTSNSMEMISVDSDQRDDPHTDELPAGGIERPTQIDSVRGTLSSWGVQLCDTPETCYSCGNLVEQMGMRWAEPGSRVSLN